MANSDFETAAVVLAGGASSRMGAPKPFLRLRGQFLIERVLERVEPQVARTYVNPREGDERFYALGRPLAVDALCWRGAGPIAGIAAAMACARADGFRYLVTAPCDAPFLPQDLVARLAAPIAAGDARAAIAVSPFGREPMFALWPLDSLSLLKKALDEGHASPRGLLAKLGASEVRFEQKEGFASFANLNTPEEFAAADAALARIPDIAPTRQGDRNRGDGE